MFACFYYWNGLECLSGLLHKSGAKGYLGAFFFSVQTMTTVGYGSIYPVGIGANVIVTIEVMMGLLGFALATGLLYGRFSKPNAKIQFSKTAVIAPYKNGRALMFQAVNKRNNQLMELNARVILTMITAKDGEFHRVYESLELERSSIMFFPLTWTLVHPIDEESPLFLIEEEQLKNSQVEILILITGFDDTFSQTVHSRFSYQSEEIEYGKKIVRSFRTDDDGEIYLNLKAFGATKNAAITPETQAKPI
jgi:inward rectifier potassium channel